MLAVVVMRVMGVMVVSTNRQRGIRLERLGSLPAVLRSPNFILMSKYDRSHILWLCLFLSSKGQEEGSV